MGRMPPVNEPIDATLAARGSRYGDFHGHAEVTQNLKRAMYSHHGWHKLSDDKREALEMIMHKVGRILNGDPNYIDSWHDIIGYARLVEQHLEMIQRREAPEQYDGGGDPVLDAQVAGSFA
jgi:hypothetical protein